MSIDDAEHLDRVAHIVSAYVGNNSVPVAELAALIATVSAAMVRTGAPVVEEPQALIPAVSIKKSVTPDFIICLEDGKQFKSLKRHLSSKYSMTPDEYRQKWGLPYDYPMVAPNYAASRSALAKTMGLGRKAAVPAPAKKAPGRKRAA